MKLIFLLFLALFGNLASCQNASFEGVTGMIYSPNYPDNYDNNANVLYTIIVPENHYIHLTFLDFFTEDPYDFVKIKEGTGTDAVSITNYSSISGDQTGLSIDINSNAASILFTSDLTNTFRGFAIKFDAILSGSVYMPSNTCSTPLHIQNFGIVTSPNFPENYPNSASCSYLLTTDQGYIIELEFVAFNTEAGYDILHVYDGSNNASTEIGNFSGKQIPPVVTSSGNSLYMFFSSDLVNNFSGFSAVYTTKPANNSDRRGVLPQVLATDPTARRDVNILKWLNAKRIGGKSTDFF